MLIDDVLYRRGFDGLLLRCVGEVEADKIMWQVHDGVCGSHQAGHKMRWLIRRHGHYWPLSDCISYAKGCEACQRYSPVQHRPASQLHPILKPWPFRGWAMDIIGKIAPRSSRGHAFILVATDYFTKWVEAEPLRNVTSTEVIRFIKHNIIHRFGIPETITTDRGPQFTSNDVHKFLTDYGIKLLHSTPYYAQANGAAEATNNILKNDIAKMVWENEKSWHLLLSEVFWAFRTTCKSSTGTTPYALT